MIFRAACLLFIAIIATSCQKKDDKKDFASVWESPSHDLDLSSLNGKPWGGSHQVKFNFPGAEVCSCQFEYDGAFINGDFEFSGCTHSSGTTDPGCSSLNSTGTYRFRSGELFLCGSQCEKYQ